MDYVVVNDSGYGAKYNLSCYHVIVTSVSFLLLHDAYAYTNTHAHTQLFNGPLSGTARVGWYQKKHLVTITSPGPLWSGAHYFVLHTFFRLSIMLSAVCTIVLPQY